MDVANAIEPGPSLLYIPAELRMLILEHVFEINPERNGLMGHGQLGGIFLDERYSSKHFLQPLLVCRQLYCEGHLLAFQRTPFIVSNLFFKIPERLAILRSKQVEALRSVTFVADARHFRKLLQWGTHPFGVPSLQLDTLTIILHRSSFWHYLFDFTSDIVKLLRNLKGVQRIVFVRNAALVKGSFRTWYNRLIGLIMKTDHQERYDKTPPNPERTWWEWSYDEMGQTFYLEACRPKPMVDEESYMQQILPLMETLRESMESEEWNPGPRSRLPDY